MLLMHVAGLLAALQFVPDGRLLAALPFLPNGRGALILILGGLAVLPVSLLWSTMTSATQWVGGIEPTAARLGLGPCRVVSADVHSCVVRLNACPTCREAGQRPGSCERERGVLQAAVQTRAPNAKVIEVACNPSGRGVCTFVIQRGRAV